MSERIGKSFLIGNNLRRLRNKANMTQSEMAARLEVKGCNMSRSKYSQMECGTHGFLRSELNAMAEIFETDFNTIMN